MVLREVQDVGAIQTRVVKWMISAAGKTDSYRRGSSDRCYRCGRCRQFVRVSIRLYSIPFDMFLTIRNSGLPTCEHRQIADRSPRQFTFG
jgi:hypothetical protein